ncbi:MAG TPA: hypothetical protein VIJ11_02040 [Galbitalea sp.]
MSEPIQLDLASGTRTSPTCSRAECRNTATMTVNWRNPRIHSLDRVKVWHACDEHVAYLHDYLAARNFPVLVAPVGTPVDSVPSPAPAAR